MQIANVVVERVATYLVKLYYENHLEVSTIAPTSESPFYPAYRLCDRAQGFLFKGTSHPNPFDIKIDLGSSGPYSLIDTLILGKNHNLAGLTLTLSHSDNDADYSVADSWVCALGINRQSFTATQHRYWKLSIAAPTADPEIGEIFLTKVLSLERGPQMGSDRGPQDNIDRSESSAGIEQKVILGEQRRARRYDLQNLEDSERLDLEALASGAYGKNFFVEDLEGEIFFAELPGGLGKVKYQGAGRFSLLLDLLEVLS